MNEHYILDVASQKGKIDWPGAIQRSGAFPLDRSSVFSSLADAEAYIQGLPNDSRGLGATSYAGQFISVYDEITKQVYPYLVQFTQNPDGSLKRILTRVLLTGDAISSDPNTNGGSSLDDTSWFIVDGGSAFDAIYRLHNAVCSIRCIDQDTQEVLYTAEPLNGYYFTAYNINNDNNYYINLDDISSVVKTLSWDGSDSYVFVGIDSDSTTIVSDNYVLNGSIVTCNYQNTLNIPDNVEPEAETKTATYSVSHYYYDNLVKSDLYSAVVPANSTTLPITAGSLCSLAGTSNEYNGWILADKISYEGQTEIPDGTEVVINYVKFGDINRDNEINTEDLTAFENWFSTAGEEDYEPIYDLDRDGYVTGVDYALLKELVQ